MGLLRGLFSLLGFVLALLALPAQAQFNNFSALPNPIFVNSPTSVKFVAALPPNPKLLTNSVRLLRQAGAAYTVVGTMRDDGLGGDDVANDGNFTLVTTVTGTDTGALNFRASAAYSGQAQRVQSSVLPLTVSPAVDLKIAAGQQSLTLLVGQTLSTAFTMEVSKQGAGIASLSAQQSVSPGGGLSVSTDLSGSGYSTSASSQTFVVQNTFTGTAVGQYSVTLNGVLNALGTTVTRSATVNVTVLAASGVGQLGLSSHPGGIEANKATPVLFSAKYGQGSTLPLSVQLNEVTQAGAFVRSLGQLRDDGVAPDMAAADLTFSVQPTIESTAAGTVRYFQAVASFPGGQTQASAILPLTAFPFSPSFQPVNANAVQQAPSGQPFVCNQLLVTLKPGVSATTAQTLAASVGGQVIAVEGGLNSYQVAVNCNSLDALNALAATLAANPAVASAGANTFSKIEEFKPNDTSYAQQWSPAVVRADEAWLIARGKGVVVAVLDTGVDYNHPDLVGRVIKGHDHVNNDADPMDDHSHGTHVAGIVAAKGHNGKGIAGMAWDTSILAIKVCSAGGSCPSSAIAAGIMEAYPKARIINMSLGGPSINGAIQNAVAAAVNAGVVVVAAAGNTGNAVMQYPCSYSGVICVGNSSKSDTRVSSSTYGPQVTIAAPGESILSTIPGGGYGYKTGTSMASPLVAGVAALVLGNNPTWTSAQVKDRLLKTAAPLPGQQIGPRVDAFDAVFNGSFEHELSGWTVAGSGSAVLKLGPITPTKDKYLGMASTGPDGVVSASELAQSFTLQPDVTELALSFSYAMVTEEYPEWVKRGYNDHFVVTLTTPAGTTHQLAIETVDGSSFVPISGIDFPGGDTTVGWTGWKSVNSVKIPVTPGGGTYRLRVEDRGDGIFDTNGLLDNIRFR